MVQSQLLSIGDLAARTGLSVSAIRFYEDKGIVAPIRNSGGHRRFMRADIRRLSFVLIAQQLGFSISEIVTELGKLPQGRAPTARDWSKISRGFQRVLETRIAALEKMRDQLDGCIGCGCLSLKVCKLYNPDDQAGKKGAGPRHVLS